MAAMAALQSSFTSLSLSSNSFMGQRLSPVTLCPVPGKSAEKRCLIVMKLKRWERKECKIGEITKIFKHNSTIIVKDTNLKTKHMKSREEGEPGQIIKIEGPIHSSNVMLYSKEQEVASRVGHKVLENGTRVRYLIKTGEIIDNAENWKKLKEAKKKNEEAVAAS
ncbi:hypothetical protein QN277_002655 [Acacia crassicarpa]|uniref:Large ribosomal subunit protein uL24 C-terminal domain-containing protein n=1 Tax=Acacia crassicarpa TaxID=499986 RepID=A0AAE1N9Z8_9FABA|nr:hypothetical protein QN277_002655 [Acacia crassicarpa]